MSSFPSSPRPSGGSVKFHKGRRKHAGGSRDHSLWRFGVKLTPVVALAAVGVTIISLIQRDYLQILPVKATLGASVLGALIAIGLLVYGLTPSARRLRMKSLWVCLAVNLAILGMLAAVVIVRPATNVIPTPETVQP